jgi:hypothetical protein
MTQRAFLLDPRLRQARWRYAFGKEATRGERPEAGDRLIHAVSGCMVETSGKPGLASADIGWYPLRLVLSRKIKVNVLYGKEE